MSVYPPNYVNKIGFTSPIPSLNPGTIIVVNADDASGPAGTNQSLADAQIYCAARSIPTTNIRQFHFGTLNLTSTIAGLQNASNNGYTSGTQKITSAATYNGVASGSALLTVMNNEITNYGCLCVIFSTYTPMITYSSDSAAAWPTCAIAAFAPTMYTGSFNGGTGVSNNPTPTPTTLAQLNANIIPANWSSVRTLRPHGRLGCPNLGSSTIAELPLLGSGISVFQNALNNALSLEQTNNSNLNIFYSSSDYYNVTGSGSYQATVYQQYVASTGFPNTIDMGAQGTSGTLGYKLVNTNPMSPQQTLWSFLSLSDFNRDGAGANYGTYAYNNSGTGSGKLCFENNYSLSPGSFWCGTYSYTFNFGMNHLYNGGSASIMSIGEPYSENISQGNEIFYYAVNQRVPLCLANFYSSNPQNGQIVGYTVCGDPLYAPFFNTLTPNFYTGKGLLGSNGVYTKIAVS